MKRPFAAAALTMLAAAVGFGNYRRYRRRRREACPPTAPKDIQTWEAEGGGVPVSPNQTAAQVSPDPRFATEAGPSVPQTIAPPGSTS